jgi:hypothetical protein
MTHRQFIAHLQRLVTAEGGQSAFARKYGRSRQEVHDWLNGVQVPPHAFLDLIGMERERKSVHTFKFKTEDK